MVEAVVNPYVFTVCNIFVSCKSNNPLVTSIVEACVCPVQGTSLCVSLWLGVTDELATLLTLDILTP